MKASEKVAIQVALKDPTSAFSVATMNLVSARHEMRKTRSKLAKAYIADSDKLEMTKRKSENDLAKEKWFAARQTLQDVKDVMFKVGPIKPGMVVTLSVAKNKRCAVETDMISKCKSRRKRDATKLDEFYVMKAGKEDGTFGLCGGGSRKLCQGQKVPKHMAMTSVKIGSGQVVLKEGNRFCRGSSGHMTCDVKHELDAERFF